jgi:hypothetical protein
MGSPAVRRRMHQEVRDMNRVFQFAAVVALCTATGLPVRASDAVQTTGQVFQSDGKTPLANATVAIVWTCA